MLRVARAVRPAPAALDLPAIVAAVHRDARSLSPTLPLVSAAAAPRQRASWPLLKAAAAVGVLALGGWSVIARQGGLSTMHAVAPDARAVDGDRSADAVAPASGERVGASVAPKAAGTPPGVAGPTRAATPAASNVAVSVGDLSDYTDAELERMLSRLERWDGATSSEPSSQVPIVAVPRSGSAR